MSERIIILGAGLMQGPAITIAKELGFYAVVLDGSRDAPCIALADRFECIDLKNKEEIEAFARSLQNSGGLGGIMTAGTDFSASVAWTAEKLRLPGVPYEAALNASDKSRMRACFKSAGLPSPEYLTITAADAPDEIRLPCPFPLALKPVDNMGGRGCRRVDSMAEFRAALTMAIGFSRSGRAIAEAYMDGPEFSVDAIVYHGEITICGLADRHICFPPYFIEMGHTMPTTAAPEQQRAILELFCQGIRSLGLAGRGSAGAAKGDIKLTPQGPMIGEIAARLSGGYMSGWTYPYSAGVRPIRAAVLAAMGRDPGSLVPDRSWTCAERAFISIPGTVRSISGLEEARQRPGVRDVFSRISVGSAVNFPENNVSKCGNIISAAPDRVTAIESAESAAASVLIRLEPGDSRTADFLAAAGMTGQAGAAHPPDAFPPDAFQIGQEIRAALEKLPETRGSGEPRIHPFPEFTDSGLTDYAGRSIQENLAAIRKLSGLSLRESAESSDNNTNALLGRSFWAAFIRGTYQGAVYYIDKLTKK